MTTMELREPGMEDEKYMDRMDIWAEALKHSLLQYKINAVTEIRIKAKVSARDHTTNNHVELMFAITNYN
jgi:hypothetical protein